MRVVLQYLEPDDEASRLTLRFTLPAKWLAADPAKRTTCRKLLQFFANSYNARLDDGSSARLNVDDYEVFDEDGNALSDLGVADALADGAKLAVRSLRSAAPSSEKTIEEIANSADCAIPSTSPPVDRGRVGSERGSSRSRTSDSQNAQTQADNDDSPEASEHKPEPEHGAAPPATSSARDSGIPPWNGPVNNRLTEYRTVYGGTPSFCPDGTHRPVPGTNPYRIMLNQDDNLVAQTEVDDSGAVPAFTAADGFGGAKPGMVFTTRDGRTGYFKDHLPKRPKPSTASDRYMRSKGHGKGHGLMEQSGTRIEPVRKPGDSIPQVCVSFV